MPQVTKYGVGDKVFVLTNKGTPGLEYAHITEVRTTSKGTEYRVGSHVRTEEGIFKSLDEIAATFHNLIQNFTFEPF